MSDGIALEHGDLRTAAGKGGASGHAHDTPTDDDYRGSGHSDLLIASMARPPAAAPRRARFTKRSTRPVAVYTTETANSASLVSTTTKAGLPYSLGITETWMGAPSGAMGEGMVASRPIWVCPLTMAATLGKARTRLPRVRLPK